MKIGNRNSIDSCSDSPPRWLKSLLALSVSAVTLAPVQAAERANVLMEEVMVTASKKATAESAQDVPIAISAYTGDQIDAMFATNLTDIGLTTPNASLTEIPTFPGVANFVIRGMGTVGQSIPSADPAVGVVIDGVSLGTIYGVVTDLFDLESIEVLRGPQGTLFGRNSTGGLVSMRSSRPTDEFEGKIRATAGNYGRTDLAAVVSGPLSDNFDGKISALWKDRGGYWDNLNLGGEHGASETFLMRLAVSYNGETFETTLIAEYGSIEADGLGAIAWEVDGVQILDPYDDRVTNLDEKGFSDLEWSSLTLESNWDLWNGRLTSILGYRELDQEMHSDIDGHSDSRFEFADGTFMEQDQLSLEVRWSGDLSEALTLTTGIYLFEQEYTYGERRLLVNAVDRRGVSNIEHSTQGAFAQVDYRMTDALTFTLGGRYTQEEKKAKIGVIGDPNAVGNCATRTPPFEESASLSDCTPALDDKENWSNFAPKAGVNWYITDDIMTYASYTRGFRSGGYNARFTDLSFAVDPATATSTPGPYNEEVVDAFELGVKSTLLDGKLRLNAAIFNNDYDDLQRTSLNSAGGQEILNAASATVRGLELEATAAITDSLTFQAGVGLIDAEYDDFTSAEDATGIDAGDLNFVLAPETTYNMALTYSMDFGANFALGMRVAYTYVDETFSDDFNRASQKDYELVDASATYYNDALGLQIVVFGKNIFDEVYYDFGTNFSASSLAHQSYWLTPPRTYGIEFTYQF